MSASNFSWFFIGLFLITSFHLSAGKLKVDSIFGNRMVLQKGKSTSITGTGTPGAEVAVTFAGKTEIVKNNADGIWKAKLKCEQYGGPHILTVKSGDETINLKDILIGEVWLCSGQSNMGSPARCVPEWPELSKKKYPLIRFLRAFETPENIWQPHKELKYAYWGPLTNPKGFKNYSAVGLSFAIDLHNKLKVPIGIIQNARGGVPIYAYMSNKKIRSNPKYNFTFKDIEAKKVKATAYGKAMQEWKKAKKIAIKSGTAAPKRPRAHPWARKVAWPTVLYNTITYPLKNYNIRGVVWYQGENDSGIPQIYNSLLPDMMTEWRELWHKPDMYFLIVQLALRNGKKVCDAPKDKTWPRLMEVQRKVAEKDKNATIVATYDLPQKGDDIHYKNKMPIGDRLMRAAMANVYGEKNSVFSGPRYKSMEIIGNKIALTFSDIASGLTIKPGDKALKGFSIAGKDKKFIWADAEIKGNKVIVSSSKAPDPIAVRYAWSDIRTDANLWNNDKLPAFPFRTDDWK